ncbi:MAG: hypothetical protein KBT70_18545 [Roseovarius sp.]|uniref:hypothetical protein n=1 Tax=Roseovarius sp. TaxID=1486281 RepID=UPI001B4EE5F8|nr:hypothetical protein [Roseovarius sp.]MBQ0752198.1 hypothetical protein [Roseovarius sp.]MBQ0812092.1 hypothetical protein [Roseovarius sp.]
MTTPEERQARETRARTVDGWVRVACLIVLPGVIFWPIWIPLESTIGPEALVAIVIATQCAAVMILPDRITPHAMRALDFFKGRQRD